MTVWKVDWTICEPQTGFIGVGSSFRFASHFALFESESSAQSKVEALRSACKELGEASMLSIHVVAVEVKP